MQSMPDELRPQMTATIEKQLFDWVDFTDGLILKLDKDKFAYIFNKKYLSEFIENKFNILDSIKEISLENKIPVTLSIGISTDGESNYEIYKSAMAAIDIALGRGGDQAVIKQDAKYLFFGGRSEEIEKRTKVKSRIVAHALNELILEAKNVVIMGHANSDIDCIGTAIALAKLVHTRGKEVYIAYNSLTNLPEGYIDSLGSQEIYNNMFLEKNQIIKKMTEETLLIIVDTHRKSYVEVPEILEKAEKVVIIDHHRKGTDFIENPLLSLHEVYASSTAELMTEILEYSPDFNLDQTVAEGLYAGIMVDTKNFTFKTGVRTFEAAAYLKKIGVDITKIKNWFQDDLDTYNILSGIVKNAEIIDEQIAISIYNSESNQANLLASKAADEMLTISQISASFVIYGTDKLSGISARSIGDINVQLILEQLGGGGSINIAGAQIENTPLEEVKEKLKASIEGFLKIETI